MSLKRTALVDEIVKRLRGGEKLLLARADLEDLRQSTIAATLDRAAERGLLESRIEEFMDRLNPIIWNDGTVTHRYRDLRDDPGCDLDAFYEYAKMRDALTTLLSGDSNG